jgi:hypothetical protein
MTARSLAKMRRELPAALGCTDAYVPILSKGRDAVLEKVHPEP